MPSTLEHPLRLATAADLYYITKLGIQGFEGSFEWTYRFLCHKEHPDEFFGITFTMYRDCLMDREAKVIVEEIDGEIRSFSIWFINPSEKNESISEVNWVNNWKYAIHERVKNFESPYSIVENSYFIGYSGRRIHLKHLVTDFNYQRQGCGSAHIKYGMELAKDKSVEEKTPYVITLFTDEETKGFYLNRGFELAGFEPLQNLPDENWEHKAIGLVYEGKQ